MADDETKIDGSDEPARQAGEAASEPGKRMMRRKAALLSEGPRRAPSVGKPSKVSGAEAPLAAAASPAAVEASMPSADIVSDLKPAERSPAPESPPSSEPVAPEKLARAADQDSSLKGAETATSSGRREQSVADAAIDSPVTARRGIKPRKLPVATAKPDEAKLPAKPAVANAAIAAGQAAIPAAAKGSASRGSAAAPAAQAAPAAHESNTKPAASQSVFSFKDTTMDMSANFNGFQGVMSEAQAKAKDAFEKSTNMLGEVSDFTKGNVEAVIESGKIFADGCQEIGSSLVAESRTAFEAMTTDVKELAAAKSPTDFFKIQSDMFRKNFDTAVAYGSKNSETMLKLMSDAMAPISGRVSLAVEKARQTATPSPTV